MKNRAFLPHILIAMALAALLLNCSTVNDSSPLSLVDPSGNHPDGWITAHGDFARPDGSLCVECHGADLEGGITGVSCSTASFGGQTCHSGGPAYHPADWLNKSASGYTWHADAYQLGYQINGLDCSDCHTPPALDDPADGKCVQCHFTVGGSRTPGGWTHAQNHSEWAGSPETAVCITCHEINIGFGNQDSCHNCHGSGGTHPDPDWAERSLHGVAAKEAPGSMTGFQTCRSCHGDNFSGGSAGVSCLNSCHGVNAPHPDGSDWRTVTQPTHRDTNRANAAACALCHQENPGTPDCFNNTLCHGNDD